eukprot:TRINITY_DN3454_c0_g1_i4.p1 TRINITY_DN3454_c0_g1~~TRINITY_DN3454_c0_g1_i4.p1  ORF type:complete len:1553 (-),score=591.00 TRINITY_DN3454_c0_g1_i4:61-4719(-)
MSDNEDHEKATGESERAPKSSDNRGASDPDSPEKETRSPAKETESPEKNADDRSVQEEMDRLKKKRKPKFSGSEFIEKEAAEDSDEDREKKEKKDKKDKKRARRAEDSSDEEPEPENQDYERDGFVIDDDEVEAEGSNPEDGGEVQRRKKKKKKRDFVLDEEDLDLIQENTGQTVARPENQPLRRLKKFKETEEDPEDDLKSTLQNDLFGGSDDDDDLNVVGEEREPAREERPDREADQFNSDESGDEMDDFVVYEDGEGRPKKRDKRKTRVSNYRLTEAQQLFGNGSEYDYYEDEEGRPVEKQAAVKLADQFEPKLLETRYLTAEAEKIRTTDLPERIQLQFPDRPKPRENELKEEAEWIFSRAFSNVEDMLMQSVVPKICFVLEFLRKDHLEVPFIHSYRKDYYLPELKNSDLWEIYDWDEKWAHLQNKKVTVKETYTKNEVPDEYGTMLEQAQTETEVQDLLDHFQLHYGTQIPETGTYKRAIKRDFYRTCIKSNLKEFSKMFGLSAAQFGDNLMLNFLKHEPADSDRSPEDLAFDYASPGTEFNTIEHVLRGARYILAQEIATDPHVRQVVRAIFEKRAEVSTFPTEKAKLEIVDAFHPYKIISRIERKPAPEVMRSQSQYLEMMKAERDGFITIKIEIPAEYHENDILREMEALYINEKTGFSLWNEQRRQILREALTVHLYPLLEKELRIQLFEEARIKVAAFCGAKLSQRIMAGPFRPPNSDEYGESNEREDIKVMSCVFGTGKAPTMCVVLDPEGEVVDHLKISNLFDLRKPPPPQNIFDNEPHVNKLAEFIIQHEPNVIAVGAQLDARKLYDELHQTLEELRNTGRIQAQIHIAYVDTEVARIFQFTERANSDFPEYPAVLRQAISLGRLLQDPLTETAGLCSDNNESLCSLKLHASQDMVGKEFLAKYLHRCFINVVNLVGVDINRAVSHKFAVSCLQFVSGLGPIKSAALIQNVFRRGGKLASREELESLPNMGPVVFTNCAGFIRIRDKYFKKNEDLNVLDDTRVHPDDYSLVRKMATDALEKDGDEVIEELMRKPKKLEEIDLDAFADELERSGKAKKKITLYDIKLEINKPFADEQRFPYRDPEPEELFTMLTGETEQTLREGLLVYGQVIFVQDKKLKCRLDNGLIGTVDVNDISDNPPRSIKDLNLENGATIPCRIKRVNPEDLYKFFMVELTCKSSELQSKHWENDYLQRKLRDEPFFRMEYEELNKDTTKKKKKKKPFLSRLIDHPLYQNLESADAEKYLSDKEIGEVVIRPSSRGPNMLNITWKLYDGLYVHYTITEEDKANSRSLGKTLIIGNEKFEDLNEVLARYVEPIVMFSRDLMKFRCFRQGSVQDVDRMLRDDKSSQPARIPYYIHIDFKAPGIFTLSYLPSQRIKREAIKVTPEGYIFHRESFTDLEKLIAWFKKHYKEFAADRPSQSQSQAHSYSRENVASRPHDAYNARPADNAAGYGQQRFAPQQNYQQPPAPAPVASWASGGWDQPMDIDYSGGWGSNGPQPGNWANQPPPPQQQWGNQPQQAGWGGQQPPQGGYQPQQGGW